MKKRIMKKGRTDPRQKSLFTREDVQDRLEEIER